MTFLASLYNELFFRPLLNALIFLTTIIPFHDLGFAVIFLTILVRMLLFPFTHHSVKAQVTMRELEPKITRIREDYKDNQEEQARKIMELYKEHGVNPFSGCLMLLIQLPLLIALYQVFGINISNMGEYTYSFVSLPPALNTQFLGLIELTTASIFIALCAAFTQFLQMKLALPPGAGGIVNQSVKQDISRMMTAQMTYVMPIVIFFVGLQFPSAVSLYWTTMNGFAIIHEMIVRKKAQSLKGADSWNHKKPINKMNTTQKT